MRSSARDMWELLPGSRARESEMDDRAVLVFGSQVSDAVNWVCAFGGGGRASFSVCRRNERVG